MKYIEQYKITGDKEYSGKISAAYRDNLKKIPADQLRSADIVDFNKEWKKNHQEEYREYKKQEPIISNESEDVVDPMDELAKYYEDKFKGFVKNLKFNPNFRKKVIAYVIAGTILVSGGIAILTPKKEETVVDPTEISVSVEEPTVEVKYTAKINDNYWSIASKYCENEKDTKKYSEMINNLTRSEKDVLQAGDNLVLYVPISKADVFDIEIDEENAKIEYANNYKEKWTSIEMYISSTWADATNNGEKKTNDFTKNQELINEGTENKPGILLEIELEKQELTNMCTDSSISLDSLKNKAESISELYKKAIALTEESTGIMYKNVLTKTSVIG